MANQQISLTSTADLQAKGREVLSIAGEFKSTLESAQQNVAGILENWKDDNGKYFQEKYEELATVFEDCNKNLQTMGELLNKEANEIDQMLAQEQEELNAARAA